jgi:hypothetical protein
MTARQPLDHGTRQRRSPRQIDRWTVGGAWRAYTRVCGQLLGPGCASRWPLVIVAVGGAVGGAAVVVLLGLSAVFAFELLERAPDLQWGAAILGQSLLFLGAIGLLLSGPASRYGYTVAIKAGLALFAIATLAWLLA